MEPRRQSCLRSDVVDLDPTCAIVPFGIRGAYLYPPDEFSYVGSPPFMTKGAGYPSVTLARPLEARVKAGHPWVYRDALVPGARLSDGEVVLLRSRGRRPLALGYWDARAPIALRVLCLDPDLAPAALARLIDERVAAALEGRRRRLSPDETTAYRWVHGEADGLPGVHVDLYGDVAAVRFDGRGARAFYRSLPERLVGTTALAPITVPGHASGLRAVIDREGRVPLWGDPPATLEVLENRHRFGVDLLRGQKGGLFLDQRENRAAVERLARGRRVLNLFGYTGGFSVYAACGGARSTDTVDLAKPALVAARENFVRNGLSLEAAAFHPADAFEFLAAAIAERRSWDLVISDPPSFAPRKDVLPAARKAYTRLHQLCARVTAPAGLFFPASCSSHLSQRDFLATVKTGLEAAGKTGRLGVVRGAGFDHPLVPWFPEGDYLKFVRVDVT